MLQRTQITIRNADIGQLAKARIDSISGLAARNNRLDNRSRSLDLWPRFFIDGDWMMLECDRTYFFNRERLSEKRNWS